MKQEYKIFKSEEEWKKENQPEDSYYPLNSEFDIICKKCKAKGILYVENEDSYDCQNIIKCNNCGNELELYGCDG